MNLRLALLSCLVLLPWAAGSQAQTLYRCGNTFSQVPCAADAASARVSSHTPDARPGREVCTTEGVARLGLPDPEGVKIVSVQRGGAEVIQFAGKSLVARRYDLALNPRNAYGAYTGVQHYACYLSEDEQRVLKVDPAGR
jgi:hypothetical protein